MSILVLAEKPSVGRDIARVIGANQKVEGYFSGNGYVVTWAFGHLVTLKEPDELDAHFKKWSRSDLPILPQQMETKVISKTRKQFALIQRLMTDSRTDSIICATDSGREGELIFRYIYEKANCDKPVQRLWISSLTDEAIAQGFASLKPSSVYDSLYQSARCRAEADWLIGMNATRAFTLRYGILLSVGRVQTPTLSMLVKRRKQIDCFIPEVYYTVLADFDGFSGYYIDSNGSRRIPDKESAERIITRIKGQTGFVSRIKIEKKSEKPPQLYDLTSLQRDANTRYGFSAKKTLDLAQKLYEERKLLTYPRTDCRYLPLDMTATVKRTLLHYEEEWKSIAEKALQYGIYTIPRVFDDTRLTDHHAIIPTGRTIKSTELTQDEYRVFDLVARRLAAVFYPNYEYESKIIEITIGPDHILSKGKTILEMGWRCLYDDKKEIKNSEEELLPELNMNDKRSCKNAKIKQEKTKPLKEYTDATLLASMENAGREVKDGIGGALTGECSLGTPATRAAIIERLIHVGYVKRKGRNLVATQKGIMLIDVVPDEIASPEMTAKWEQVLERIAKGETKENRFQDGIRNFAAYLVSYTDNSKDVAFETDTVNKHQQRAKRFGVCPLCGKGDILENSKAFYCSNYRNGCKYKVWKDALIQRGGPELTAKLFRLCVDQGIVRGSTGTIHYNKGQVQFESHG